MQRHYAEERLRRDPGEALNKIQQSADAFYILADQLLATEPDKWNVIIGDDTSGRLPAHFVYRLLKGEGRGITTFFVVNTKAYRKHAGPQTYEEYFKKIEEEIGEPLRPLIVTESVGTGETVNPPFRFESGHSMLDNKHHEESTKVRRCRAL